MNTNQNQNNVWVIVSNNVPVEAYEDEFIAQKVASEWNKQSSVYVTYYRVSLVSQTKTSEQFIPIKEKPEIQKESPTLEVGGVQLITY